MKVYLAGSIYAGLIPSPDRNLPWREWITPKLAELGINVLNPLHKPHEANSIPTIKRMKREEDFVTLKEFCVDKIIFPDLKMIEESNGIIAVFERDEKGRILWSAGTAAELFFNWYNLGKKAFVVIPGMTEEEYVDQVGAFIIGMVTRIFNSFEELLSYFRHKNISIATE
jgi:hypothetical protein